MPVIIPEINGFYIAGIISLLFLFDHSGTIASRQNEPAFFYPYYIPAKSTGFFDHFHNFIYICTCIYFLYAYNKDRYTSTCI